MIVYKAVSRGYGGGLSSAVVSGKANTRYRLGVNHHAPRWLADEGYHLTAFKTLRQARNWARDPETIWRCEATDIIRHEALPPRCYGYHLVDGDIVVASLPWPEGTIMCKTIKLLKELRS